MSDPFPILLMAAEGFDADGAPMSIVAHDLPEQWKPATDKQAHELQHLSRFRADYRALTGADVYADVLAVPAGEDPPDFRATFNGRPIGVECSQLVFESRVETNTAFRSFRLQVMAVNRNRFRHLRGRSVQIHFDNQRAPTKPGAVKQAILALCDYVPIDAPMPAARPPEKLPEGLFAKFPGGQITSTPLGSQPNSLFYNRTGFELSLTQNTHLRHEDAWAQLADCVTGHDKPGVDHLLVSVCAPTTSGYAHPSDAILLRAIHQEAQTRCLSPQRISRVIMHDWSSREIEVMIPGEVGVRRIMAL